MDDIWEDLVDITVNKSKEDELPPQLPEGGHKSIFGLLDVGICGKRIEIADPEMLLQSLINEDYDYNFEEEEENIPRNLKKDIYWEEKSSRRDCEVFSEKQHIKIKSLPTDCIIEVFSFLGLRDLICVGQVNKEWKEIHKHNVLWKPMLMEVFGNCTYDPEKEKQFLRTLQRKRGDFVKDDDFNFERSKLGSMRKDEHKLLIDKDSPDSQRKKKKKRKKRKHRRTKEIRKRLNKRFKAYTFWSIFKRRMKIKEKEKLFLKKKQRRERILDSYRRLFSVPKFWLDCCYLSFFPFAFIMMFLFTFFFFLWFMNVYCDYINFIPPTLFSDVEFKGVGFIIVTILLVIFSTYFLISYICSVLSSFFKALMDYDNVDGTASTFLLNGFLWSPILFSVLALKLFIFPSFISWSISATPLYVFGVLIQTVTYLIQWKSKFFKWKIKQKVTWVVLLIFNIIVWITCALRCIHGDNHFKITYPFTQMIFLPIWACDVLICCSIPIIFWISIYNFGWKKTLAISPLVFSFLLICVFTILFALNLDRLIQSSVTSWCITFLPIFIFQIFWFIVFVCYYFMGMKKNVQILRENKQRKIEEMSRKSFIMF